MTVVTALLLALASLVRPLDTLPECQHEDDVNCVWHAAEHGNGQGHDYVAYGDQNVYLGIDLETGAVLLQLETTGDSNWVQFTFDS